jgi:hypothetical protein
MKGLAKIFIAALLGVFLLVVPALAIPVLDFGTGSAGVGGLLTMLAGPNATGAGVPLDTLIVSGAPGAGVYDLSGAFVSGTSVGGNSAVLDFDTRAATNFIKITGGVPALGIPNGTILLSGTFSSALVTNPAVNVLSVNGLGSDDKDPGLLRELGIDPNLYNPFTFFGFTISANFDPGKGVGNAISSDITNSGKIPEPISLILLGSGLAGAGLYRRLRKPKG